MRDDRNLPLSTQLVATAGDALRGTGIAAATSLALVVLSGIVAPGASPGAWTWLRVLAIWLLVALALAQVAGAASGGARPGSALITWGALIAAVAIGLSFPALATVLTVLAVVLLMLAAPGSSRQPGAFWTIAATVTPLWVWSAFEAWDRWLLMLVPLAAVGLISLEHAARSASARNRVVERIGAWVGLLAIAAATLLVALLAGIDPSWVTVAAVAVPALGAIDLALARTTAPRIPSLALPGAALLALALGWMAAL